MIGKIRGRGKSGRKQNSERDQRGCQACHGVPPLMDGFGYGESLSRGDRQ
jgi:hypothetical protein